MTQVLVKVGDEVKSGVPLFRLDDRQLQGDLVVKRAAIAESRSALVRLEAEPRKEKIPVLVAAVKQAEAGVIRETYALRRSQETYARRVTT